MSIDILKPLPPLSKSREFAPRAIVCLFQVRGCRGWAWLSSSPCGRAALARCRPKIPPRTRRYAPGKAGAKSGISSCPVRQCEFGRTLSSKHQPVGDLATPDLRMTLTGAKLPVRADTGAMALRPPPSSAHATETAECLTTATLPGAARSAGCVDRRPGPTGQSACNMEPGLEGCLGADGWVGTDALRGCRVSSKGAARRRRRLLMAIRG